MNTQSNLEAERLANRLPFHFQLSSVENCVEGPYQKEWYAVLSLAQRFCSTESFPSQEEVLGAGGLSHSRLSVQASWPVKSVLSSFNPIWVELTCCQRPTHLFPEYVLS